jgi:hypothetical protein
MSLNFRTSFMSTERETESCKVFVGFVLPFTRISNPGMTYRDRVMGHCLWMDGWKVSRKTTTTSFTVKRILCDTDFNGEVWMGFSWGFRLLLSALCWEKRESSRKCYMPSVQEIPSSRFSSAFQLANLGQTKARNGTRMWIGYFAISAPHFRGLRCGAR